MTAGWAFVHGLAVLLVEKRLRGVQKRAPDFADRLALVDAAIDSVTLVVEDT